MGACLSAGPGTVEQRSKNRAIERDLKQAKEVNNKTVRILLLGAGDSGKSTIVKQMRIIHTVTWTPSEIESYRQLAFLNVLDGMRELLTAMRDELHVDVAEENVPHLPIVLSTGYNVKEGDPFPPQLLEPLTALWSDPGVQDAYQRGNEVALPDSLHYFFNDLPRLWQSDYTPNNADIIHCRARTTGMTETVFKTRGHILRFIDVGGQKSERRKWINFFDNVTSVLFLVSLSGYDQCLIEDRDANQMQDAMQIWDGICNSQWFMKTALILFLNKTDLFEEKIKRTPLRNTFPDYDGPEGDFAASKNYFRQRFVRLSQKSDKQLNRDVYTHFTTATNTNLLKVVMTAVEECVSWSFSLSLYLSRLLELSAGDAAHSRDSLFLNVAKSRD